MKTKPYFLIIIEGRSTMTTTSRLRRFCFIVWNTIKYSHVEIKCFKGIQFERETIAADQAESSSGR